MFSKDKNSKQSLYSLFLIAFVLSTKCFQTFEIGLFESEKLLLRERDESTGCYRASAYIECEPSSDTSLQIISYNGMTVSCTAGFPLIREQTSRMSLMLNKHIFIFMSMIRRTVEIGQLSYAIWLGFVLNSGRVCFPSQETRSQTYISWRLQSFSFPFQSCN